MLGLSLQKPGEAEFTESGGGFESVSRYLVKVLVSLVDLLLKTSTRYTPRDKKNGQWTKGVHSFLDSPFAQKTIHLSTQNST